MPCAVSSGETQFHQSV